jgi:hypothetical protein
MILRRVIEHVKAQNWTAVGLDFIIVVMGVFIGIQVANLKVKRGDAELEKDYLSRLAADMEFSLVKLSEKAELYKQQKSLSAQLISAVADSSTSGADLISATEDFFTSAWVVPEFNPVEATFQDLSSTGNLKLIHDPELRAAIIALYARYHEISGYFAINEQWILQVDARLVYEHDVLRWDARYKGLFPELSAEEKVAEIEVARKEIGRDAGTYFWVYDAASRRIGEAITLTAAVLEQIKQAGDAKERAE